VTGRARLGLAAAALALGTALGAIVAGGAGLWGATQEDASPRQRYAQRYVGHPAPDFSLSDLKGNTVRLSQARGKVVLLNFWYSACPPCRRETPDLITLHRLYAKSGLEILGVNLDDILIPEAGHDSLGRFLKEFQPPYPVLLGDNTVFENYGEVPVQPISFLIDRQGNVAHVFWGAYPGTVFEKTLRPYLEAP
jgi:cytochrome c biogenesis protein CcmG/thiol:disulfide interchange protein DsbE